jgi:diketogulonate reductase-like aldo/keto reductase
MQHVDANGMTIPALGFGTFRMEIADVARMVPHVLGLGYRHIDTAQVYLNEEGVGAGIAASGVPRSEIFLTTKVWVPNFGAETFARSVDESLAKLRTDYVDLLLLHWPSPSVPLAEQLASLNAVRKAGKARNIGLSNYTTKLLAEAVALSETPLATNQIEFHPYLDQTKVYAATRAAGMAVTAYYAMANGSIIGDPTLTEIGAAHGKTEAQVVLRWLTQKDGVAVLSKTLSETRAASNLAIFDFTLSPEDVARIDGLARPDGRLLSPPKWAPVWDE